MKQTIITILLSFLIYYVPAFGSDTLNISENKVQVKRKAGEKDAILFADVKTNSPELKLVSNNILEETRKLIKTRRNILPILQNEIYRLEIPLYLTNFEEMRERNVDYIVTGTINYYDGKYHYKFFVWDIYEKKNILAEEVFILPEEVENFPPKFASRIYEFITGEYGFFYGKLLYTVTEREGIYPFKRIALSKKDGNFIQASLLTDGKNITFNPRSCKSEIMYSMQEKRDGIRLLILDRKTGVTQMIKMQTRVKQSTFAPNFSSNCMQIIFSSFEDGATNLYILDRTTNEFQKLTKTRNAINTSAVFAPGNEKIFFISDRSGKPKVWEMRADGSDQKQVTFGDGSDFAPHISSDGKQIAFVNASNKMFHLKTFDLNTRKEETIFSGFLIEDPTWTPSGKTIVFSMKKSAKDKSRIYAISANSGTLEELEALKGFLNEPKWINEF